MIHQKQTVKAEDVKIGDHYFVEGRIVARMVRDVAVRDWDMHPDDKIEPRRVILYLDDGVQVQYSEGEDVQILRLPEVKEVPRTREEYRIPIGHIMNLNELSDADFENMTKNFMRKHPDGVNSRTIHSFGTSLAERLNLDDLPKVKKPKYAIRNVTRILHHAFFTNGQKNREVEFINVKCEKTGTSMNSTYITAHYRWLKTDHTIAGRGHDVIPQLVQLLNGKRV